MRLKKLNEFLSRLGLVLVVEHDGINFGKGLFQFAPNGDCKIYLDWFRNYERRVRTNSDPFCVCKHKLSEHQLETLICQYSYCPCTRYAEPLNL